MERPITNFKEQILEQIVSKSEYINRAFANHIALSNKAIRELTSMNVGSSKVIKSKPLDISSSTVCKQHFVRLKSRVLRATKYILPKGYDLELLTELFITRVSETEFQIAVDNRLKPFGDDSVDDASEDRYSSEPMADVVDQLMSEPESLFKEFKDYFRCDDEDVEYRLDEFVRIKDITAQFPHNYYETDLAMFYLNRVKKYRIMSSEDLDMSEKFQFSIEIDTTDIEHSKTRNEMHRNISYYERTNHWQVAITREFQTFCTKTDSLEDAIELRDKVLKFYEENGKLPSFEEVGHSLLSNENRQYDIKYDSKDESWTLSIRRGKHKFVTRMKSESEINSVKDKVLEFYDQYGALPKLSYFGLKQSNRTDDSEPNVYYVKLFDLWRCSISRKCKRFEAFTKSKQEAIDVRNKALQFYEENGQLPTHEEINFVSASKARSNSKLSHICKASSGNLYIIQFSRNYVKFNASTYSIEDAIEVRDRALSFYNKHNRIPTYEEIGFDKRSRKCIK